MSTDSITEGDLNPSLKKLWLKSLSAIEMHNLDYSVSLLLNILKEEPGFLQGRKTMRAAAIQAQKGSGKKGAMMKPWGKLKGKVKKDPVGALNDIETELAKDPTSIDGNRLLSDSALSAGMFETAAFALETVRENHLKETKALHELAQLYLTHGHPEKAAGVFTEIVERDPTDGTAAKAARDASARASMSKSKFDGKLKDNLRDSDEAAELEQDSAVGMTREQMEAQLARWLEKYAEDQNNLLTVRKVANLYEQLEDFGNAASYFEWAFSLSEADTSLQRKGEEMRDKEREIYERQLQDQLNACEDEAQKEELQAALDVAKKERLTLSIDEARDRVERNPTDPQLRFDLGQFLFQAGEYTDAIPQLQKAKNNPHIRTRAIFTLGKCYDQKNMNDLAVSQYDEAVKELLTMDGVKKDVLYHLGLVLDKMGEAERSLDAFKEIYNADYDYRDVAKRVEQSYQ
ncbi:MAG: tetratricopeptide repeat protein [Verrucomicrobiales bacterium]